MEGGIKGFAADGSTMLDQAAICLLNPGGGGRPVTESYSPPSTTSSRDSPPARGMEAVSYTHLTLPTSDLV